MIKLIITDIDGTLVPDGNSDLNPEYYETIKRLKDSGIVFVAASGRQFRSMETMFAPVKEDMVFVAENGGYVCCRGYDIGINSMNLRDVHDLIRKVREIPECELVYCTPKKAHVETKDQKLIDWLVDSYHFDLLQVPDLMELTEEPVKVSIYHATDAEGTVGEAALADIRTCFHAVCAGKEWVDCLNKNANKGNALLSIQRYMKISREETMAFGDNMNDIEMLSHAAYSFAIGNARTEVKKAARYVADTNKNDGVLQVMKKVLENNQYGNSI